MAIKRLIKRHKKYYPLKFGIHKPMRLAFTEDISAKGLFIRTTNITPIGTRILIELDLPNDDKVSINGIVCWARKMFPYVPNMEGMGVEIKGFKTGETAYRQLIAGLNSREQT